MGRTGNLKSKKRKPAGDTLCREVIFGPAPVLRGEDTKAYDLLLEQVSTTVKPSDIIEDIWVRDIVDLTWEILRLRRYKQGLIETAMGDALPQVLGEMVQHGTNFTPTSHAR